MRGIKSHARSAQGRVAVIFVMTEDKSSGARDGAREFTYRARKIKLAAKKMTQIGK